MAARLELDIDRWKVGDRAPPLSGLLVAPAGVDLAGAAFTATLRGRVTGTLLELAVVAVLVEGSTWRWSHAWEPGETDVADTYDVGVTAELDGRLTAPSDGWGEVVIQEQLAADPVP
jgi:hypothetical protein